MSDADDSGLLTALLAIPDNGGIEVCAGRDANWHDVCVALSDEVAESLEVTNRLVIIIRMAHPESWAIDARIRRLADAGAGGLAVDTGIELGDGTRGLAERLGVSLIRVHDPVRLAQAAWELVEGRDALALRLVRRVAATIQYRAEHVGDLVGNLAANLGQGVAVIDASGVVIEAGPPLPAELMAQIDPHQEWIDLVRGAAGAAASVAIHNATRPGLRLVLHGEQLGEAHLRALGIAVEIAMPAVAARLLIDEVNEVNDASRSSSLLGDFLEEPVPTPATEARMLERGWHTSGWHMAFRIVGRGRIDPLLALRRVTLGLQSVPAESHATLRGAGVSGWITLARQPGAGEVEAWVQRLRDLHRFVGEELPVATGVGTLANGAVGLAHTLREARDAARMAVSRTGADGFVHIDRFGLEQLMLAWTRSESFHPVASTFFAPLSEVDRATLIAYLDHESSTVHAAAALGVHRNTLTARIRRIEEVLGVALDDPETRLALHLAARAIAASDQDAGESRSRDS